MTKLRKTMMMIVLVLAVVLGTTAGTSNAKATTIKNFKGNLNVTYKNSEWKSKITIKTINSKKVSIKIVLDNNWTQGTWNGKVISKDTIQFTLDGGEKIKLKWKDKTHFTAKRPKGGFSSESVQLVKRLCFSLNNTKYTQVQKSNTVYYSSTEKKTGTPFAKLAIKGNKVIVKGKLTKGTKKAYANVNGNVTEMKKGNRTFKFANNVKFYGNGGENPEPVLLTKSDVIEITKVGRLPFVLTVKNGKVTRIDFYS